MARESDIMIISISGNPRRDISGHLGNRRKRDFGILLFYIWIVEDIIINDILARRKLIVERKYRSTKRRVERTISISGIPRRFNYL